MGPGPRRHADDDRALDTAYCADEARAVHSEAPRLKQRIKVVLDWARVAGQRPSELANPVEGITHALPRHKGDKAHHPALPYQQVPAFVQTLRPRSEPE